MNGPLEQLGWPETLAVQSFWNQLDYFGIIWILLSLQAVSEGSLCKLFLQLNSLNTLESFRAALGWP